VFPAEDGGWLTTNDLANDLARDSLK